MTSKPAALADEIGSLSLEDETTNSDATRDAVLQKELEHVRAINASIETVIASLDAANNNMGTLHTTVDSASSLLSTWTKILSQTEHNQRLLLDPEWPGTTQELEEMENLSMLKQQAAARRAAEEQSRREDAERTAREQVKAKSRPASLGRGSSVRSRVRSSGYGRAPTSSAASSTGHVSIGGPVPRTTRGAGRSSSGIGRGGVARSRGTGLG